MGHNRMAAGAVGALAAVLLLNGVVHAGEVLLHDNGAPGGVTVSSVVRLDAMGNEVSGSRAVDDFVLPDLNGSGLPLVVTSATGWMTSSAAPAGDEEVRLEIYADNSGSPGALLRTIVGEIDDFSMHTGGYIYELDFDGFTAALEPGVRYWAAIVVRTPQASTQPYARRANDGPDVGLRSRSILVPSGTISTQFFPRNMSQVLRGYQVEACPPVRIDGTAGTGQPSYSPSKVFESPRRRAVRDTTGAPPADTCIDAASCNQSVMSTYPPVNLHSFINDSPDPVCVVAVLTEVCESSGSRMIAYRGDYTNASVCTNAVAQSSDTADFQQISFVVDAGEVFHIVVAPQTFGSVTCPYSLWVRGLAGCSWNCPGDANGDGAVDFSDITGVLQNWQGECPEPPTGP